MVGWVLRLCHVEIHRCPAEVLFTQLDSSVFYFLCRWEISLGAENERGGFGVEENEKC